VGLGRYIFPDFCFKILLVGAQDISLRGLYSAGLDHPLLYCALKGSGDCLRL